MSKHVDITILSREELIVQVTHLQHQVALLQKMVFGPRNERFKLTDEVPSNQLSLGVSTEPIAEAKVEKTTVKGHDRKKVKLEAKKHPGRNPLPSSLRREEIVIEPTEDVSGCVRLEDEVTEVLEVKGPEFYVKRYVRHKYVRKDNEGITIGKLPNRAIEKGIPGASVLAMLIISKFIDHLPIYRQLAIFKRAGIILHYNTVLDWTNNGLDILEPIYDQLRRKIIACHYLQADETGMKVLDSEKNGSTHQGYLWAYRDVNNNLVLFEYQRGRNKEGPAKMLKDFKGYLQTDGYAAYDQFYHRGGITMLHCVAHARRYFKEAEDNDKDRSSYALKVFQEVYQIERQIKDLTNENRKIIRQESILPKLNELHIWMTEQYRLVTPKSPIGKALEYSLKRWKELTLFTIDGQLEIDNNKIENEIRPIALGRKNYLFAGSHESAQRIAMIYSLLASCKTNEIDPMKWLTHVLEELPTRTVNNIDDLMPQKGNKY
jgi:transposase